MFTIMYADRGWPPVFVQKTYEAQAWQLYRECCAAHPDAEVRLSRDGQRLARNCTLSGLTSRYSSHILSSLPRASAALRGGDARWLT
jgi:hypothetical protein